jgi:hypothetical protein
MKLVQSRIARLSMLAAIVLSASASAQPIFVNTAATGANTGATWADAYTDLQPALAGASGREIWIARGTYYPGAIGASTSSTFSLPAGVTILGGFVGTETLAAQRAPAQNPVILSGDLGRNDPGTVFDNASHIVTAYNLASATLDGLTITAGRGAPSGWPHGGGLLMSASTIIIRDTSFVGCTTVTGSGGAGGGAAAVSASNATFIGCRFTSNSTGGSTYMLTQPGGAFYASSSTVRFTRCEFLGNHAGAGASAWCDHGTVRPSWYGSDGGALAFESCTTRIEACKFIGNASGPGGPGMTCWVGTSPRSGPGSSGGRGAAISATGGTLEVVSCVFAGNTTGEAGYSPVGTGPAGPGIDTIHVTGGPSTVVACTFVSNSTPAKANLDLALVNSPTHIVWTPGDAATPIDPRFISATGGDGIVGTPDDDLRLMLDSPYIDAGVNSELPADSTIDAAGMPRYIDIPTVADTGQGTAPIVDRGAYEAQPRLCAADFNSSGTLTVQDIFDFLNAWFGGSPSADFNGGGLAVQDIFDFLNAWFAGCR